MPVKPLFIKDRSTLLKSLRLADTSESTSQQVDEAIAEVRTELYNGLGATRITEILTFTVTDTPATVDELVRSEANTTEHKWVRLLLLRRMPSFFLGSSGEAQQEWNQAEILRQDSIQRSEEITRLQSEVDCGLGKLQADAVECLSVQATVIGPAKTNTFPGAGIYTIPHTRHFV